MGKVTRRQALYKIKEWEKCVEKFRNGELTVIDQQLLAEAVEYKFMEMEALEIINEKGATIKDGRGSLKKNPAFQVHATCTTKLQGIRRELGIDKENSKTPKEVNPLADILGGETTVVE